ncbi:hypothetical protein Bpfe_022442 [Biomphalaria pfeifferi]|uniref:Uncharacterized protein n=1 Tax=Biomphalaria pfeifferi TaxID=112525 RepID=A0AAD8F1E4_BIOPF|nr:hypothetical protein Bpfe_022442 [Biomphalaria pfeifferi]
MKTKMLLVFNPLNGICVPFVRKIPKKNYSVPQMPDKQLSPGILTRLDDGDGVEETFMKKKASFHMSCRLKYNTTKLKRKLASCDPGEESVIVKNVTRREQRSSGDGVVDKDLSCFLCDKKAPSKDLRHASTFKVDERIRNCALILQESHLLAKLSRGDVIAQELK